MVGANLNLTMKTNHNSFFSEPVDPTHEARFLASEVVCRLLIWMSEAASLEELLVALSDKLWKGKREAPLEKKVVESAATLWRSFWDVFVELDTCFESVAAGGADRLGRSGDAVR